MSSSSRSDRIALYALTTLCLLVTSPLWAAATVIDGQKIYEETCASCHGNPNIRAPELSTLLGMSKDSLTYVLTEGKMKQQAIDLSVQQRQALVDYLGSAEIDPYAWETAALCKTPGTASVAKPAVAGWGFGNDNHRYQSPGQAGVSIDDLAAMELAYAIAFPGGAQYARAASHHRAQSICQRARCTSGVRL